MSSGTCRTRHWTPSSRTSSHRSSCPISTDRRALAGPAVCIRERPISGGQPVVIGCTNGDGEFCSCARTKIRGARILSYHKQCTFSLGRWETWDKADSDRASGRQRECRASSYVTQRPTSSQTFQTTQAVTGMASVQEVLWGQASAQAQNARKRLISPGLLSKVTLARQP